MLCPQRLLVGVEDTPRHVFVRRFSPPIAKRVPFLADLWPALDHIGEPGDIDLRMMLRMALSGSHHSQLFLSRVFLQYLYPDWC